MLRKIEVISVDSQKKANQMSFNKGIVWNYIWMQYNLQNCITTKAMHFHTKRLFDEFKFDGLMISFYLIQNSAKKIFEY